MLFIDKPEILEPTGRAVKQFVEELELTPARWAEYRRLEDNKTNRANFYVTRSANEKRYPHTEWRLATATTNGAPMVLLICRVLVARGD